MTTAGVHTDLVCPSRQWSADHIRPPEQFTAPTAELFSLVEKGELSVRSGGRYPPAEAARAHTGIESRRTMGKLQLIP
ncbi:zinc-binding dehydrogenase [Streptomyces shenzhenensis]